MQFDDLKDVERRQLMRIGRIVGATLSGGAGGFGLWVLAMVWLSFCCDGTSTEMARLVHLSVPQFQVAMFISLFAFVAMGIVGCGLATARHGRIEFGPRVRAMVSGAVAGVCVAVIGVVASWLLPVDLRIGLTGSTVLASALQVAPLGAAVGAAAAMLAYHLRRRRERR